VIRPSTATGVAVDPPGATAAGICGVDAPAIAALTAPNSDATLPA